MHQVPPQYSNMAGLLMQIGDVVPFRNPLGASANQLQPETLNKLRQMQAQNPGLSTEMLKYLIAQQMQSRR
jgi:hypothetical protein